MILKIKKENKKKMTPKTIHSNKPALQTIKNEIEMHFQAPITHLVMNLTRKQINQQLNKRTINMLSSKKNQIQIQKSIVLNQLKQK